MNELTINNELRLFSENVPCYDRVFVLYYIDKTSNTHIRYGIRGLDKRLNDFVKYSLNYDTLKNCDSECVVVSFEYFEMVFGNSYWKYADSSIAL